MRLAPAITLPLACILGQDLKGQMRDNRDKDLTCRERVYRRQVRHCDLREQSFASIGSIAADPGANGGVTVKGWLRNDVLVRSRIEAWASTDAKASALASQVRVDISGGAIVAHGPLDEHPLRPNWAVSFEIFVPRKTNVTARAVNGGIGVPDVDGTLQFHTVNGGIRLSRVAGDVIGATQNGGIDVELAGRMWQGAGLELRTTNGGVTVSAPQDYSADLEAETVNGGIRSDIPVTVSGRIGRLALDAKLGSGGPLIHVSSVNGGVYLGPGA